MIEELAKIAHKGFCEAGRRIPPPLDQHDLALWSGAVRAILERLREPTPEMIRAGQPYAGVAASSAKRTYQAMLSAIDEKEVG